MCFSIRRPDPLRYSGSVWRVPYTRLRGMRSAIVTRKICLFTQVVKSRNYCNCKSHYTLERARDTAWKLRVYPRHCSNIIITQFFVLCQISFDTLLRDTWVIVNPSPNLSDFDDFGSFLGILSEFREIVPAECEFEEKGFIRLFFD